MLEHLVQLRTEVLGEDDPRTIDALSDLTHAIAATGNLQRSEAMQREAVTRSERVLGRQHGNTIDCKAFLAQVLHQQGKQAEATVLQREILATTFEVLGPRHINVLMAEGNLASMLSNHQETYNETYDMFKSNIQKKQGVYGLDHRETLVTVYLFGVLLGNMHRLDESMQLHVQVLNDIKDGPRQTVPTTQKWRDCLKIN